MSWNQIRFFSLAFLIVVVLSRYLGIFQAIHSAQRPTIGEIFFALAVGATTFVTYQRWVYAAALLQMSLADGLAAVIGVHFGKTTRYRIFGSKKSIVGTLVFFFTSLLILFDFSYASGGSLGLTRLVATAVGSTVIENLAGNYGLDNLFVPLLVAGALTI
jgi:dolichol kinase